MFEITISNEKGPTSNFKVMFFGIMNKRHKNTIFDNFSKKSIESSQRRRQKSSTDIKILNFSLKKIDTKIPSKQDIHRTHVKLTEDISHEA